MGRPSGFDRGEAVEQAMQEIWRNGYGATSVSVMAGQLGINRSSYYNAFGSREGLFRDALVAYLVQSPDRVLQDDLPDLPIRVVLTRLYREICRVRAADPAARGCLAVNALCELSGVHGDLGSLLIQAFAQNTARLDQLLMLGVSRGELPGETDTRTTALALQTLMVGINTLSRVVRDGDALWRMARMTLQGLQLYQEDDDAEF